MDPGKTAEKIEQLLIDRGCPPATAYDRARQIVREFLASGLAEVHITDLGMILYDKRKAGK